MKNAAIIAKLRQQGIDVVNLDARTATVQMRAACSRAEIAASEDLTKRVSQFYHDGAVNVGRDGTQFNYENIGDVMPTDADYVSVKFRALSKTIVIGHWIDWTTGNVLKDSVSKLLGQTVYPNHDFTDINNWLGSVSAVEWDEAGAQTGGVPGINATYKIDALLNPRIARGLLMQPPAIHSTSMTVLFKFEVSHQEIYNENKWRFYDLLGEEVDGEIVRLIVTEILEYWEASLVFQGADRLAKRQDETDEENDLADMSATTGDTTTPELNTGVKLMKLTAEQKRTLGIGFEGDDVPETEILTAAETLAARIGDFNGFDPANIAQLTAEAEAGRKFTENQRAEVTRLARLAELGAGEGELPSVVAKQIAGADFDTLVELESYFNERAAARFPKGERSSAEGSDAVETAGGVKQERTAVPAIGLH